MKTDFPTASAGTSQAPSAAAEKSHSASHTEILTLPFFPLQLLVNRLRDLHQFLAIGAREDRRAEVFVDPIEHVNRNVLPNLKAAS